MHKGYRMIYAGGLFMYYTDGFLDENTYDSRGHIWHFGMKINGKECLFCCVIEETIGKTCEEVEVILKRWFQQEIASTMKKDHSAIKKELLRFKVWLKNWYGPRSDVNVPILFLDIGGRIYTSNSSKDRIFEYRGDKSIEEVANAIRRDMLVAHSQGKMERGYFIMWEAIDDF
jgi:hypothetical protein